MKRNIKLTELETKFLESVTNQYQSALEERNKPRRFLGDRSINEFIDDCHDLFNGYVPEWDGVEDDWKSRAFKKKTRHKVIATVAAWVGSNIGVDFSAVQPNKEIDRLMSRTLDDIYLWSLDNEADEVDFDMKETMAYMQMAIEGVACLQEGIEGGKEMVRDIIDIDYNTYKVQWVTREIEHDPRVNTSNVPLSEMYLGDFWEPDIQKQPYVIRRRITTYNQAKRRYENMPNFKFVEAGQAFFLPETGTLVDQEIEDTGSDQRVEIIHYYNKDTYIYNIIINGIPMMDPENPIPFVHRGYPFSWQIGESFADRRCAYGNSICNVNKDDQELTNDLWRMMIDSIKLKNKPPIMVNDPDLMNTDIIIPGLTFYGSGEEAVRAVEAVSQGVGVGEFNILRMAESQQDENTIDPLLSGKTPQGDPTATEVNAIVGSAQRLQGFTERFVGNLHLQHAKLRIENLLWLIANDETYREVVIDGVVVDGQKGKRRIRFVGDTNMPSSADVLKMEAKEKQTEILYINIDTVNDYRRSVSLAPISKPRHTSLQQILRALQKFRIYAGIPNLNIMEAARELIESFGDDPEKLLPQQQGPTPPLPVAPVKLPGQNPALDKAMVQAENL